MIKRTHIRLLVSAAAIASSIACSGEKKEGAESEAAEHGAAPPAAAPSAAATGDTILIETWTDGTGNYFKPNKIEAHPGDVLRYVLKQGVHNVHFLPDSNTIRPACRPQASCSSCRDRRTISSCRWRRDTTTSSVIRTRRSE